MSGKIKVKATMNVELEPESLDQILREVLSRDYLHLCEQIGKAREAEVVDPVRSSYLAENLNDQIKFRDSIISALEYYMTPNEHRKLRDTGKKICRE